MRQYKTITSIIRHPQRILPILIAVSAICALTALAAPPKADAGSRIQPRQTPDSLTVSLITCWPGEEVYELCGHEAIRVRGQGIDSVWNYGTFDFTAPGFIYRFVKGETDYMLSSYPFEYFMPEYINAGRRVVEQELNLSQEEARRLLDMLRQEALPQNRVYRYNYVKDNCATRIVDRLDQALGKPVVYTDTIRYGTFRREMRAFHRDYPWYQFGIDLALGSGLDYDLRGREEMFVPLDMMRRVQTAVMADGRPLVRTTSVLNQGVPDATLGPSPWWTNPLFWSIMLLLFTLGVCIYEARRKSINRWLRSLYFGVCGLAGCVIAFLVLVSSHEATSPNVLILWLNPLQLITAICVWWHRTRRVELVMSWYNIIAVGVLLLVWPFQAQSANPAFFPLMACAVALGGSYAIISPRICYNKRHHHHGSGSRSGYRTTRQTRRHTSASRSSSAIRK